MHVQQSLYAQLPDGQVGVRPDIRNDVREILDTAVALNSKFESVTQKFQRAMSSPSHTTYVDNSVTVIGSMGSSYPVYGGGGRPIPTRQGPHGRGEREDSSKGLRIFGAIALTLVGLFLTYKIGGSAAQVKTTEEGTDLVNRLNESINQCRLTPGNDIHKSNLRDLVQNARIMFQGLKDHYRDRDLIPKIVMLAGVILGVGACILDSGALLVAGFVFGVGSAAWMLFNSSYYSRERGQQKELLQGVIQHANEILHYTSPEMPANHFVGPAFG